MNPRYATRMASSPSVYTESRRTQTSDYVGTPLVLEGHQRYPGNKSKTNLPLERCSSGTGSRREKLIMTFKHVTTTRPSQRKRKDTHYPTSPAHRSVLPGFYERWESLPPSGRSQQFVQCSYGKATHPRCCLRYTVRRLRLALRDC